MPRPSASSKFRVTWLAGVMVLLWVMALGPLAGTLGAQELEGTVRMMLKGGKRESRSARSDEAVVVFVPDSGAKNQARPGAAGKALKLTMRNKAFLPRVLNVPVGTEISFPNEDPILHNVFSVSGENRFDLGLYGKGKSDRVRFDHAGTVRVYCNVHPEMVAWINVLPSPFFVVPERDGTFRLTGLPAGGGTLMVWHPRTEPLEISVTKKGQKLELAPEIVRPRIPNHKNKQGKPYRKRY